MSDLDEKLKAIELDRDEFDSINYSYVRLSDAQILYIKQAFIDAGWLAPGTSMIVTAKGLPIMTGKEWYDRFEKELQFAVNTLKTYDDPMDYIAVVNARQAAKKSAGIE